MSDADQEYKSEIDVIAAFNSIYAESIRDFRKLCKENDYEEFSKHKLKKLKVKKLVDMTFERYLRIIKEDPQFALTEFGPVMWFHKDRIMNEDVEYFLKKNYQLFLQRMSQKYDFDLQYSIMLVDLCKEAYSKANEELQDEIKLKIKQTLVLYSKYVVFKMDAQENSNH